MLFSSTIFLHIPHILVVGKSDHVQIKIDSREVKMGDIFVALPAEEIQKHIEEAIHKGAMQIIAEKEYETGNIPLEIVDDAYSYTVDYLDRMYQEKLSKIKIIGITGTNGKTTTSYLTYQLLNALGMPAAYIGTIGFHSPLKEVSLNNTTPDIVTLYTCLLDAQAMGCQAVVMEVSSHALAQNRLGKLRLDIAGYTNLSQDHLDYHKTMREYLKTKLKIKEHLKPKGKKVLNADDIYSKFFYGPNMVLVGKNGNDIMLDKFSFQEDSTRILFSTPKDIYQVETNLTAEFNVYNYLMALAIARELGFSVEDIIKETPAIYGPKGRCQKIKVGESYAIIDYAHTPDAVEKIIESVRKTTTKKIITVLGCGGDRDHGKRPIMGNIAVHNSDFVIFTDDNPRTETSEAILSDILKGVGRKKNYVTIPDRKNAIYAALEKMQSEYVVLILGKGHEDYQIIGTEKIHFDDAEIVASYSKTIAQKALISE